MRVARRAGSHAAREARKREKGKTNRESCLTSVPDVHKSALMLDHHDLCERAFKFACDISRLCVRLQERGPVIRRLSMKLLDSGTSIGANIEEGRAGQTKPDFIAKNFISLNESRETRFWLRVIGVTDPPLQKELQPFLQEASEFVAMLTTTLKNASSSQWRGTQNSQ
jgi:four helix bundle protein